MAAVQEVEMKLSENAAELGRLEFEYDSRIKIKDLQIDRVESDNVQVAFVFGDLIDKVKYDETIEKSFLIHSTPEKMSDFLAKGSLKIFFISITDSKLLGELTRQLKVCD